MKPNLHRSYEMLDAMYMLGMDYRYISSRTKGSNLNELYEIFFAQKRMNEALQQVVSPYHVVESE